MRKFIFSAGVVLFVLAVSCLYVGVSDLSDIRPASDYEDKGIHTFMPYQTLTTQVKNTATGRQQRLHPTKSAYWVCYRATDGTNYEWKNEATYREAAEKIVAAGEPVERRVLSIKENGYYITVESDLTAESYVFGQSRYYGMIVGLSALYLVIYLAAWVVILRKRRKEKIEL